MSAFNGTLKLKDGKLHLFKQPKSKNFFWRTFLSGKYVVRTDETDNLALASPSLKRGMIVCALSALPPAASIFRS